MIGRVWHGWTTRDNADAYEHLLLTEVLPGIRARDIAGYHGAYLYRRDADANEVEFVTTMFFDSMNGVREFAGDEHSSVVPPTARALLKRFEEHSTHYEVRRTPGADDPG